MLDLRDGHHDGLSHQLERPASSVAVVVVVVVVGEVDAARLASVAEALYFLNLLCCLMI